MHCKTSKPAPTIQNLLNMKPPYILKTPNRVPLTGALNAAEKAKASTRRVSLGAMMPSSHSRAVA
jgi:hypothetical protein